MKKIIMTAALLCMGMVGLQAQTLKFNDNGKFKIVQFTDIHWVPGNPASEEAAERMNEVLDAEKPDLVIYTGDLIFAKPAAEGLDRVLEPAITRHIPFAVTWGNHDDEQDLNRSELSSYVEKKAGCLNSRTAGITGVSNFILPVQTAAGDAKAAVLYIFDSNAYSTLEQLKGYGWIEADQVEWYRKESAAMTAGNGGQPLPSLAFFHIPFPEYNQAAQHENALMIGTRKERACAPPINTGLYAAMLQAGDVMGTFVGHDHVNDYVVNWHDLLLCYGRFTGGKTVYHDIPGGNGARVIELTEGERGFRTWIQLKGNRVLHEVTYPDDFVKAR